MEKGKEKEKEPKGRPDVAERKKLRKTQKSTVIKCGLLKRVRPLAKEIVPLIESAVLGITRIAIQGSRLINLILLDLSERERSSGGLIRV